MTLFLRSGQTVRAHKHNLKTVPRRCGCRGRSWLSDVGRVVPETHVYTSRVAWFAVGTTRPRHARQAHLNHVNVDRSSGRRKPTAIVETP